MPEINKKILIVTYYWPPSGGSGVQRWLKFVKYLPQFGWKPFIFTPENPAFSIRDESLLKDVPPEAEVIRLPIWEPYDIFFRISRIFGGKISAKPTELVSAKKKSFFQKVSTWIRGNLFIPDPRIFWVKPAARFLTDLIEDNDIQTVITTGPPHSIHLIGLKLKKRIPSIRWIADFRDPWSEWGLFDSLNVGTIARNYHRKLERKVLSAADALVTITPFYVRKFESLGKRKVHLLTNGFDEDDFKNIVYTKTDKFVIRHVGIVNEKCDPRPFMEVIKRVSSENKKFAENVRVEFIGEVHPDFREYVNTSETLSGSTVFKGNIPHNELIKLYGSSSLLLLILTGYKDAEGYMPGKLFEYFATGLPVLGVGPVNGDAADLLRETKAGEIFDTFDADGIKRSLIRHFDLWSTEQMLKVKSNEGQQYSRRAITGKLVALLNSATLTGRENPSQGTS